MRGCASFAVALLAASPYAFGAAAAQASSNSRSHIERLTAVPLGALPPVPILMPASRNRNYWAFRLQAGRTGRTDAADLTAYAGGIDFQREGGSVFGLTAGYQTPECSSADDQCDGHALAGVRARFNLVTGGPTIAALIGDYSASTTLGAEFGFGYGAGARGARAACATDFGMPISVAMLQTVRVVSFLSPGITWDFGCAGTGVRSGVSLFSSLGLGVQQLWFRGLDVSVGLQRIFRGGAGFQMGVTVSYVRLP
jgi:hypothetical protein